MLELEGGFPDPFCHRAEGLDSGCFIEELDLSLGWLLAKDTLHGGGRDAVAFGDLADTLATLTVLLDGEAVQHQRSSADAGSFEARPPHAGTDSLDDQAAFQFRDGADDHDDGPAQRAAGVDLLAEARRTRC